MGKNMKKMLQLFLLILATVFLTNCVTNPIPLALYGNYKGTLYVFPEKIGTKMGRSCTNQFGIGTLPLFVIGDASAKTAADNGKITKISIVEFELENILTGVYAKTCTVVYGE